MFRKFFSVLLIGLLSATFVSDWVLASYYPTNYNNFNYRNNHSKIKIYQNGVSINGKYYTKSEFEKLLQQAEKQTNN